MRILRHKLIMDDGSPVTWMKADKDSGATLKQDYIIIHYTAGASALSTANFFASSEAQASAHFCVDRDGSIIQQVKCNTIAWHAGQSSWKDLTALNPHSIGIELANWGLLSEGPTGFKSWLGTDISDNLVIMGEHRNSPGKIHPWELFPEAQFKAAAKLCAALAEHYDIREECVLGHDDISPGRKIDPGPSFNMDIFKSRVFGTGTGGAPESERFEVKANNGLNMREGPGISYPVIAVLPNKSKVSIIEKPDNWWMVSLIQNGHENTTGYVHSHWLERV